MVATLTMAFLYISNGKYNQKELINGSCVVAICLDSLHSTPNLDEITKKVASELEIKFSELDNQIQRALATNTPHNTTNDTPSQVQEPTLQINSKEQAT